MWTSLIWALLMWTFLLWAFLMRTFLIWAGVKGLAALISICRDGHLPDLEDISLNDNLLKGAGCLAPLAEAVAPKGKADLPNKGKADLPNKGKADGSGVLTKLRYLQLDNNEIGDAAFVALCRAIGKGGLPRLAFLDCRHCGLTSAALIAISDAARAGGLANLASLEVE